MKYRIKNSILSQIKESYATGDKNILNDIEIDCSEGINLVSFSKIAIEAFNSIDYTIIQDYPHSTCLQESIIKFWDKYTNTKLDYNNITLYDGSIGALFLINKLFIENGDKVLGLSPQFPEYGADVFMCGGIFNTYKLNPKNNYKFIVDEFLDLINDDLKLIYIDNPNNPTGQIINLDDIKKIVDLAYTKNIVVLIDEAYGDYMNPKNSAINLIYKYENLVVSKTFSKAYGLAGLRGGYSIQNKNLTNIMNNVHTPYEMGSITRYISSKVIFDYEFLLKMQNSNKKIKEKLIKNYKNLSISETGQTTSIMLVTHKNKDIDLQKEFSKLKISVISCSSFNSLNKNSIRFRLPSSIYLNRLIEAFSIIDDID